jgi:SAM-dependent methyltransferase
MTIENGPLSQGFWLPGDTESSGLVLEAPGLPAEPDRSGPNFKELDIPPEARPFREKLRYYALLAAIIEKLCFPPKSIVAILGVGDGLEVEMVANALDTKERRRARILSVDRNVAALEDLRARTSNTRILAGLTQADILVLSAEQLPLNSCLLVTLSSVLHQVESEKGFRGVVKAFQKAISRLAPGGFLIIREFAPPLPGEQRVVLKTQVARDFFSIFVEHFWQPEGFEWTRRWSWQDIDTIRASNMFVAELLLHFRHFHTDHLYKGGVEVIKSLLPRWSELGERYVLGRGGSAADLEKMITQLKKGLPDRNRLASHYWLVADPGDNALLRHHFELQPLGRDPQPVFPLNRMIIVVTKMQRSLPKNPERAAEVSMEAMQPVFSAFEEVTFKFRDWEGNNGSR